MRIKVLHIIGGSPSNGSFKGAIWINSTSFPGKQPISNNCRGTSSKSKDLITPFSPTSRSAIVRTLLRMILNIQM